MKKQMVTLALVAIGLVSYQQSNAQEFPKLDVSPMDAASYPANWREADKLVKVVYSRPQLKKRTLEKLAPAGKVWRTGANEAAEITFYKDVLFGDKEVKKGTYTLFTIPGEKMWTVILSNQMNVWGSYFYKEEMDVVRVEVPVAQTEDTIEVFSIVFDGENENAMMHMGWANTVVSVPVKG